MRVCVCACFCISMEADRELQSETEGDLGAGLRRRRQGSERAREAGGVPRDTSDPARRRSAVGDGRRFGGLRCALASGLDLDLESSSSREAEVADPRASHG